ncbi:lysine--tRNA ligase [candidate division KSB1 bacterium]|nr:lysine--tRNA ligase [candidate division KSB1 bacterium]
MDEFKTLTDIRLNKLDQLKELEINPYAYRYEITGSARQILDDVHAYEGKKVSLAGRLMSVREHGKTAFAHLMDSSGKIQFYVRKDKVGDQRYDVFKLLDIGDIIGIVGDVFITRTGETTVFIESFELLAKSLRPLPIVKEKLEEGERILYDEFTDKELRYRQRYVDLIVNPDVKEVFLKRSKITQHIREFLLNKNYLEVETPILQPIYGGAAARPFITHHNALDIDLYLRIADELYLKRLIVGGFDGVFEFGKDFRNEGIDRFHNPEFTMLELYVAYQDYHFMMALVEDLVVNTVESLTGGNRITFGEHEIDFSTPWPRYKMFDIIKQYTDVDLYQKNRDELKAIAKELDVEIDHGFSAGKIIDEIFSAKVEPKLIQPCFVIDYPVELSPLAKKHRTEEGLVERFEGFIAGKEFCNAFSELNDPLDQRDRFEKQVEYKKEGDEEAHEMDDDYIRALEYGMPPTAGLGIGIDRLVMILTNSPSIRDVILFPHMRPE